VENFIVVHLSTRRIAIGFEIISTGTLDTLLVHAREVFKAAIVTNASAIAADNTCGHGNVKGMIRNRLDAATLDRFAFLRVDYDEQLEAALCGNVAWAAYVKQVRDYIAGNSSESVYITPRASLNGAALLAGGLEPSLVADATVFKFCSVDLKQTLLSHVGPFTP
jgi:hypothetical protein